MYVSSAFYVYSLGGFVLCLRKRFFDTDHDVRCCQVWMHILSSLPQVYLCRRMLLAARSQLSARHGRSGCVWRHGTVPCPADLAERRELLAHGIDLILGLLMRLRQMIIKQSNRRPRPLMSSSPRVRRPLCIATCRMEGREPRVPFDPEAVGKLSCGLISSHWLPVAEGVTAVLRPWQIH